MGVISGGILMFRISISEVLQCSRCRLGNRLDVDPIPRFDRRSHVPLNEPPSGQFGKCITTSNANTSVATNSAIRPPVSILRETWPSSWSNQLWRPRVLPLPPQSIHQGSRLHRLVPLQTHNRHNQHPQLLQSLSRKRPLSHRKHQTRCHGQRRGLSIRVPHNFTSRIVLFAYEYVPSQSHGDGY
jgi:hypothetical protein